MNTNKSTNPAYPTTLTRFLAIVVISAMQTALHATLPTSGIGWTLTENPNGSWVLVDLVDDGWTTNARATMTNEASYGGLTAEAGDRFYYATHPVGNATGDHLVQRTFDSGITLQEGTYTVTFKVGKLDGVDFLPINAYVGLYSGTWNYNTARISSTALTAVRSNPTNTEWVEWTFTYVIDADTKTVGTTPTSVVGTQLGFVILSNSNSTSATASYAFDSLNITYTPASIPESGTTAVLVSAAMLIVAIGLKRSKR